MSKPPLTTEDVSALTTELYALSDSELLLEADAIAADYLGWMEDKFDLAPEQITYISSAPTQMQKFWGYLYAASFASRGPITFGALPPNPPPRRIKECRENFFGFVTYNNRTQQLTGGLEIEVEFQLLS